MKDKRTQDINDINNEAMIDEDDEFIVEYRNGDFVSEEYEPSDVAKEIEGGDTNDDDYYDDEQYIQSEEYEDEQYSDEYVDDDSFDTSYGNEGGYHSTDNYDMYESYNGDYEEDEEDGEKGFAAWLRRAFESFTVFDAVLGITGVVVIVAVIVFAGMYFQTKNTDKQVAAIAPLGEELSGIGIVGSEGLIAMSGSAYSGAFDDLVADEEEISTVDVSSEESSSTKVSVSFSSVEKDLKVRFTDASTGALITGTAFEVTLTSSGGKTTVITDDDMDGIIYVSSMTAGTYSVVITSTDKFKFPTTAQSVTVKDKVQYVVVNNIQDEVKTEKQVDVAVEDTQKNDAATEEETIKDTVEWVESSKTAVDGSESYLLVDKDTITDPSTVSMLAYRMLFDGISVSLDKSEATVTVGDTTTLSVNETFKDKEEDKKKYTYKIEWKSDKEDVATVSGGTVTAKSAGTATITCTVTETIVEEGEKNTEKVTDNITVDEFNKLSAEEQKKCDAQYEETSNKNTSNENTSNDNTTNDNTESKITGYKYTHEVTTQTEDKTTTNTASATCKVTVEEKKVEKTLSSISLSLSKSADSCAVGSTLTVSVKEVTRKYSDDSTDKMEEKDYPTVTWKSNDTAIATVSDKGVVTGVKVGKTKISGEITIDGKTAKTEVEVEITEAKDLTLTLDRTSEVYIAVGGTTTLVATVANYKSDSGVTWTTSDKKIATVDEKGVVTGVSAGSVKITATTNEKNKDDKNLTATCVVTINSDAVNDKTTLLKDKNGNQIYIKDKDGKYVEAVYADYFTETEFYIQATSQYAYTGWQTIDGKTYYYDKNGVPVTGTQVINGVTYNFGDDGAIASNVNGTTFGIDVSRHNGTIDWNAVKASGVDFVIIRCGYRGSSTGALIEDQNFKTNIKGATAAGLKVGVYVFSQAINEVEAVKEASLAVSLVKGYNLTYPIFIDTESSGGRADNIDKATRTAVVNAFCQTVIAGGYKAGIYASKSWYETKLDMSSLGSYRIWLAQYAAAPTYKSKFDMWQYSCKGQISGINGNVDLNYSYLGY